MIPSPEPYYLFLFSLSLPLPPSQDISFILTNGFLHLVTYVQPDLNVSGFHPNLRSVSSHCILHFNGMHLANYALNRDAKLEAPAKVAIEPLKPQM